MFMSNTYDMFLEFALWLMMAVAFIAAASFVTKGVIEIVLTIIIEAPLKTVKAIVKGYKASSTYFASLEFDKKKNPVKTDSSAQAKAKPDLDLNAPTYLRWNMIPQELKSEHEIHRSNNGRIKNARNYATRKTANNNVNDSVNNTEHLSNAEFVNDTVSFNKDAQIQRRKQRRMVTSLKGKTFTSKGIVMD